MSSAASDLAGVSAKLDQLTGLVTGLAVRVDGMTIPRALAVQLRAGRGMTAQWQVAGSWDPWWLETVPDAARGGLELRLMGPGWVVARTWHLLPAGGPPAAAHPPDTPCEELGHRLWDHDTT